MTVINRLQRLSGESEKKNPDRQETINDLRKRIDVIMTHRPEIGGYSVRRDYSNPLALADVIPGEEINTSFGSCFVAHHTLEASEYHGHRRIGDLPSMDMEAAAMLANNRSLMNFDFKDALFLDTETTGLAGGTGTVVFLVGLGWFEDNAFVTKQIFAEDFSEEKAALALLQQLISEKRFLVTFNGKAFDINLLATRFIMNRLSDPLSELPHLDLLPPSRRLLGHRLVNCRLSTLEASILGLHRQGDIPGSEIPQRYFAWLRQRNARLMADVFKHNSFDIISIAVLMTHLTDLLTCKSVYKDRFSHHDSLAAARFFHHRGLWLKAQSHLESLMSCGDKAIMAEAGKMISLHYKRTSCWEEATKIWKKMVLDESENFFAVEELAKWLEHKARDYKQAIDLINQALDIFPSHMDVERNNLTHRLHRLQIKWGKTRRKL
jgi:hypothetical protein